MALLGFEGFDYCTTNPGNEFVINTAGGVVPGWSNYGGQNFGANKVTGFFANSSALSPGVLTGVGFAPGSTYTTLICGFHFKASSLNIPFFYFYNTHATAQCSLQFSAAGKITFNKFDGTVLATGATTIVTGAWYFCEVKVTFNTSAATGQFEVHLDGGVQIASTLGITAQTGNLATAAVLLNGGGGSAVSYDDFYLCDDTTATANTFLGPIRVETLFAVANSSVAFTPLSGTNASNVDEVNNDGDTTYNFSASTGQVDTFTHGALSATPATIYGVSVVASMRKDDTTAQTVRTKLVSGATTQNGVSDTALTTVYTYLNDMYITDPNTSLPWTGTNVNNSLIGYEHV